MWNSYEFFNPETDESIEVEAQGFENACHILFHEWEYPTKEWELIATYDLPNGPTNND